MLGHCDWLQDSGAQWGWEGLAGGPRLLDARSRQGFARTECGLTLTWGGDPRAPGKEALSEKGSAPWPCRQVRGVVAISCAAP